MKASFKFIFLILSILLVFARVSSAQVNWVESPPSDWLRSFPSDNQIPVSSDHPTAGAVYLLDEDIFYVADKVEVRVVIMKIFNRRGYHYAEVTSPYYREGESVEIRGRTRKKDGTVIQLNLEDIHEISISNDLKKKKFSLPGVEDDCLIHYEIVYRSKKYTLSGIRYFQNDQPTLLSRFNLVVPKHLQVISFGSPPGVLDTAREVSFFSQTVSLYTFAKRDLLAQETEPYIPPSFESLPSLAFALSEESDLQAGWANISRWYFETFQQHFIPTKEMKKLAKELTREVATQREKAEKIFFHVQSHFQVIFPSRSIFDTPQTIFNRQVGSSAEIVGILYALLKSVDIPATPVLVPDRQMVINVPDVPMLDWFSHLLLRVDADGQEIWLDPYYATNSIDCISDPYQNIDGLLVKSEGGELIRTPSVPYREKLKVSVLNVSLNSDGKIECEAENTYSLSRSGRVKSILRSQTIRERKDELAKSICEYCPGAILDTCFIGDLYDYHGDFRIFCRFHSSNYVQQTDSMLYLNPQILYRDLTATDFSETARVFPIMFDQLMTDIDTVKIALSPSLQVEDLPESLHLQNDFAEFHSEYDIESDFVNYRRTFIIKELKVPANSYPEVKSFFNQIFMQDQKPIVLKKKEE